jgi:hypothetical protein
VPSRVAAGQLAAEQVDDPLHGPPGRDLLLLAGQDLDRPGQLLDVKLGQAGDGLVRHQLLDPAPVLPGP